MAKATIFISEVVKPTPTPDSPATVILLTEHFHVVSHGARVPLKLREKGVVWSNKFGSCFNDLPSLGNQIIYKHIS